MGRTPLLLLNGLGANNTTWAPVVANAPEDLTLVLFDAVHTLNKAKKPMSMRTVAKSVVKFVQRLDIAQVDVLGISWGGLLAQNLAAHYPQVCRKLVLVSTLPCGFAKPAKFEAFSALLNRKRFTAPEFARKMAPSLYGGSVRTNPELAHAITHGEPAPRKAYLYQWLAGLSAFGPPYYPAITQPTLIMSGTDDPLIPFYNALMLRYYIGNSTLYSFDDGHLGLLTHTKQLLPIVAEFLRD